LPDLAAGGSTVQPCFDGLVAQEALDGVDADGLVELPAVARRLARVVADAAHHGGNGLSSMICRQARS
jgi:hypothetical protein